MTEHKEFEIYGTVDEGTAYRRRAAKFECECGSERRVDEMTECKICGAWYEYSDGDEPTMVQSAPPQFLDSHGESTQSDS